MKRLKQWYRSLSNETRAALATFANTTIGTFALTATGWLGDVAEWANSSGATTFPSLSVLGYGAVAAVTGAAAGATNWVYRKVQSSMGWGSGPVYSRSSEASEILGKL